MVLDRIQLAVVQGQVSDFLRNKLKQVTNMLWVLDPHPSQQNLAISETFYLGVLAGLMVGTNPDRNFANQLGSVVKSEIESIVKQRIELKKKEETKEASKLPN